MKFGILSMQRVRNYGSFMQALSLKRMIEALGNETVFVDYKTDCCAYQRKNLIKRISYVLRKIKRNICEKIKKVRGKTRFKESWRAFYDFYGMLGIDENYHYHTKVDTLVIGSDEVFNCLQNSEDVGFSMELFGKNNRAQRLISYAASFGNTTLERLEKFGVQKKVAKRLKDFDSISVRDKNSGEIVKALTGKEPIYHMDPVFVGDIETLDWKPIDLKDYIIVYGYFGRFREEEKLAIKSFAEKKGLKTIAIGGKQDFCDESIRVRVDELIPYFKNARYVITETFHGTLFSIITHTPFVTIVRNSADNSYGNEEKLSDLLERLNVEERRITDFNTIEEAMLKKIDFEKLDNLRRTERERTLKYLKGFM